jgi:HTH-type transcriptional regulator/antitoxin HigA
MINNEQELIMTQNRINSILDQKNLTEDDRDYLKILGMLIYEYEKTSEQFPELEPQEVLRSMIEDEQIKLQDLLGIFKTESTIFDILNNQRELTREEAEKLINYAFKISQFG